MSENDQGSGSQALGRIASEFLRIIRDFGPIVRFRFFRFLLRLLAAAHKRSLISIEGLLVISNLFRWRQFFNLNVVRLTGGSLDAGTVDFEHYPAGANLPLLFRGKNASELGDYFENLHVSQRVCIVFAPGLGERASELLTRIRNPRSIARRSRKSLRQLHLGGLARDSVRTSSPASATFGISVILPCYNAEATLPACLDSLFSDPGVDLEVIAVDDHSKDGTLEVLRRYRETVGDRLKIFHNSENRGAYYCRNIGLHFATRDWVTFQDADDLSVHSRFSVVSEYVRLNPEVRMLYGYYRRIDSEGRILNVDGRYDLYGLITLTLKRKDALEAVGYYRPLRVAADSEYAKRAERNLGIDRVLRIHHCLYYATMSPDSLSGSLYRQVEGQPGHYVRAFAGDSARMAMMEEIRLKYELSQGPVPREDFTVDLGITRAV